MHSINAYTFEELKLILQWISKRLTLESIKFPPKGSTVLGNRLRWIIGCLYVTLIEAFELPSGSPASYQMQFLSYWKPSTDAKTDCVRFYSVGLMPVWSSSKAELPWINSL